MGTINETVNIRMTNYDDLGDRISIGSDAGGNNRVGLIYNAGTESFNISQSGATWTNGITTYTTPLNKIGELQTALPAVRLPPNTATLKLNDTLLCDAGTIGKTTVIEDGTITVNNNTGGTTTPAIVLNQTGTAGGVLVEEIYNQRNPITGEFNRMSFYAKTSTGAKVEYARIHQNAPVITNGSQRGRIDLAVNQNGNMIDFISLNGSTNEVSSLKPLNMNTNVITNIDSAGTAYSSVLAPQRVSYLTTNTGTPTDTKDANMRQLYFNNGVAPTLKSVGSATITPWDTITCSATFNSQTWVSTSGGRIFYSSNPSSSWNDVGVQLDGQITCMKEWNGYLMVGGTFTTDIITANPYNRIALISTTPNCNGFNWTNLGTNGFNGDVLCFEVYNTYLFVGGTFTHDSGITTPLNRLAIVDTAFNVYNTNNNTTDGFNAPVRAIANDITGGGSNRFIIGGDFSTFTTGGTAFSQAYYLQVDFDSSTSYNVVGFFTLSPSLSSSVYKIVANTLNNSMVIAGSFSSIGYTDYIFQLDWNGSSYQPNNFAYGTPVSQTDILYLSPSNNFFWSQGSVLYNGSTWSITGIDYFSTAVYATWGQDTFATISSSQNPIVLYYRDTSQNINITLNNTLWVQGGASYTNFIYLANKGNSIEIMWNSSTGEWFLISNNGATFA